MSKEFKGKISKIVPRHIRNIISQLEHGGYEAYVVGGCVRDILLGLPPNDWDITTSARPEEVIEIFTKQFVIPTGLKHGTVNVVCEGTNTEVTTFRTEGEYADNRRPDSVQFVSSIKEDLARRDFTINAMAMSIGGDIIDYFGGKDDLQARCLRCVGNPSERLNEDALRILRAIRFASVLDFVVDENTKKALINEAFRLKDISAERKKIELSKLIYGKNASGVLREYSQIIAKVIPEILPMIGFDQKNRHHCYDLWEHTIITLENIRPEHDLRWAALLHDIGKPSSFSLDKNGEGHFYGHGKLSEMLARDICNSLKFDGLSKKRILLLIKYHDADLVPHRTNIKRWLNKIGQEAFLQLIEVKRADNLAQAPEYRNRQEILSEVEKITRDIIAENECLSLKDLAINGNDCINMGIYGKDINLALNTILALVINDELENEREILLAKLPVLHERIKKSPPVHLK